MRNAIKKRVQAVKDFFSDFNIDKLKEYIENLVTSATSSFENLDPWVIGLLMYRFCQLVLSVQDFLKSPIKGLQTFASGLVKTKLITDSISQANNRIAVKNGAIRFDRQEAKAERESQTRAVNNAAKSPRQIVQEARDQGSSTALTIPNPLDPGRTAGTVEPLVGVSWGDYVPPTSATSDEIDLLESWYNTGLIAGVMVAVGNARTITIRKDGTETGDPGPGWRDVDEGLWLKLLRAQGQMEPQLATVTEGFNPSHPRLKDANGAIITVPTFTTEWVIALSREQVHEIHVLSATEIMIINSGVRGGSVYSGADRILQNAVSVHLANEWILRHNGGGATPVSEWVERPSPITKTYLDENGNDTGVHVVTGDLSLDRLVQNAETAIDRASVTAPGPTVRYTSREAAQAAADSINQSRGTNYTVQTYEDGRYFIQ
jgi:hypothetical protein